MPVLKLNELASALRPRVVQAGREAGKGGGFLDDGTIVVIDGGRPAVGQLASVAVTRLLPTGSARSIFEVPGYVPASLSA